MNIKETREYQQRVLVALLLPTLLLFSTHAICEGAREPKRDQDRSQPTVWIEHTQGGFRLIRNAKPYFVKGACGVATEPIMDQVIAAGGNSIRTWGVRESSKSLLDLAHAKSLTVCPTLWVGQDNNTRGKGFDYTDQARVDLLCKRARENCLRYKEHPALLVWGVGNEMESGGRGSPGMWKTINKIAAMIHGVDPNHPTMTVVAEVNDDKIHKIQQYCPSIDILGVNSYGGIFSLSSRIKRGGWTRPYMVTEYGVMGTWEVRKTGWRAPVEPTSTQKAEWMLKAYRAAIAPGHPACLGSYVYIWKRPQSLTGPRRHRESAWFYISLADGSRTNRADVLQLVWTGKWPQNRCPDICNCRGSVVGKKTSAGSNVEAVFEAADYENNALHARWEVRPELIRREGQGTSMFDPPVRTGITTGKGAFRIAFKSPETPGAYTLQVVVHDGNGNAATFNAPFYVTGPNE